MANLDIARNARWQNVAFVLGAWLYISPWVLGFSDAGKVATKAWIFGIIIALLALTAIFAYQGWEEWLTAAIDVWVFISPLLGAVSNARILWSSLVVGALLVILALWSSSLPERS